MGRRYKGAKISFNLLSGGFLYNLPKHQTEQEENCVDWPTMFQIFAVTSTIKPTSLGLLAPDLLRRGLLVGQWDKVDRVFFGQV